MTITQMVVQHGVLTSSITVISLTVNCTPPLMDVTFSATSSRVGHVKLRIHMELAVNISLAIRIDLIIAMRYAVTSMITDTMNAMMATMSMATVATNSAKLNSA